MTADRRSFSVSLGLFALGLLALVVLSFFLTWQSLARAYLMAWVFWMGLPAGATVLLLVHGMTGGRWGDAARPVLAPLALLTPLVALGAFPVFLLLPDIYPWVGGAADKRDAVSALYLNAPAFVLRGIAILTVWSALAWLSTTKRLGAVAAALSLLAYTVTLFFASVDWIMSTEAAWASTAFPALIAVSQVAAALALLCIAQARSDGAAEGDFAGMLIAAMLGVAYLAFIQGLVMWSGNLPEKVDWYVRRLEAGGEALLLPAFIIGAVIPFLMLLLQAVRQSRRLTAVAALFVLAGLALHTEWLFAGILEPGPVWLAPLLTLASGAIVFGLAGAVSGRIGGDRRVAHG